MDYEEDFQHAVQDAITALNRKGVAPQVFSFDGRSVTGWSVETTAHDIDKGNPIDGGYWEEYWDRGDIVLASDGTFWDCGYWQRESSSGSSRGESMRQMSISEFVGHAGKPFSEWKSQLERRPYRGF